MRDRREELIARTIVLLEAIPQIAKVGRNVVDVSGKSRPALVIWDGDEAIPSDPMPTGAGPRPTRPLVVEMMFEVRILAGSEDVGTELNKFRRHVILAVLTDAELRAAIGTNGDLRYLGLTTELAPGRTLEGQMAVSFAARYPIIASELA